MKKNALNFLTTILAVLMGSAITYIVIVNPFGKKVEETTSSGVLGCQYTSCTNKVIVDNTGISASVEKVYDSVVMIENYKSNKLQGTGSGFVYKVD